MKFLKTEFFEKKAIFQAKKIMSPIFPRFIECDKHTGNTLLGSTTYPHIYCGNHRSIFLAPKKFLKTKVSEKKLPFQRKKNCRLFFLVLSNVTNLRGQFNGVKKVFRQLLRKLLDHFSNTHETVENTDFWKKAIVPAKKIFSPVSPRFIECDKPHETMYWGA